VPNFVVVKLYERYYGDPHEKFDPRVPPFKADTYRPKISY